MHPPWRDRWRTSGAHAALFAFLLASPAAGADDPEPLADFTFSAQLEDAQNPPPIDRVQAMGRFRLGPDSDGADPGDEEVLVSLGPFSHTFPAGSFRRSGDEVDVWRVNDPAGLEMRLRREGTVWTFRVSARNLGLSGIENPLSFVLRIGDDEGRQSRYFGRFPRGAWEVWEHPAVTDRDADDDGVGRDAGDCDDQAPWVHPGAPELCNGGDDDCDASVDEGFDLGSPCEAGIGACMRSGVTVCSADGSVTVCGATPGLPSPEVCNGLDDDCDGGSDESFELGLPCTAGVGACASAGVTVCSADGSGTGCGASPAPPSPEACNGLDDDCDGTADEDLGALTCGTGLCARTVPACLGGVPQVCLGKDPLPEICGNGVDEDCDGADLGCPEMVLAFTSPPSLATVAGSPVQVEGTVTGDPVELTCNGIPALVSGGSFTAEIPLHEGRNAVTCLARDANGLMTTAVLRFTLDTTPPVVLIESPRDGQVAAEASVTVTGTFNDVVGDAFDNAEVAVSCNGQPATVGNRTFTVRDLSLRPGANALRCTATDLAGNSRQTPERTVVRQALAGQRIQRVSGEGQSGPIGTELPQPLVVRLVDGSGLPVEGRTVTFRVSRGSGTLLHGAEEVRELGVTTGVDGQASARFRLGLRAGSGDHRVTATALGFAGEIDFAATAGTGEPDRILAVGGDVQRGTAGALLPLPLVVLVVDVQGNPVTGVPVTFRVVRGTGDLDGQPSVTFETGTNGRAAATFRLGPDDGVNNNVVEALFPGLAGLPAVFLASGLLPGRPEDTRFTGVVLDNADLPIPGATVTIPGTALQALTDEQGLFRLDGVPVGTVHLRVDARTSPRPETFTVLEFEATTIAGRENTVGMPILIPALDTASARRCGGPAACTLSMAGVPGMTVTIFPGSAIFPGGAKEGDVLFTQVHLDKVPMLPPDGALLIPAWTLQPGGTHFDPPAAVTIPNTAGLRPGEKAEIFQFDHDIGDFVSIGLGTVSEDGSVIASDPGYGITSAGWGGFRPPPPPTTNVGPDCQSLNQQVVQQREQEIQNAVANLSAASALVWEIERDLALDLAKLLFDIGEVIACVRTGGAGCAQTLAEFLVDAQQNLDLLIEISNKSLLAFHHIHEGLNWLLQAAVTDAAIVAICPSLSARLAIQAHITAANRLADLLNTGLNPAGNRLRSLISSAMALVQSPLTGAFRLRSTVGPGTAEDLEAIREQMEQAAAEYSQATSASGAQADTLSEQNGLTALTQDYSGCHVQALNRTASIERGGNYLLGNVAADGRLLTVRVICGSDRGFGAGRSGFLEPVPNGNTIAGLMEITGTPDASIRAIRVTAPVDLLQGIGDTAQITVTALSGVALETDVTARSAGTSYLTNAVVCTITPNGLVTAARNGTCLITAVHDGVVATLALRVETSGDTDGDGLPDDFESAFFCLDPRFPNVGDADGDELWNTQELDAGTNPCSFDTDADLLSDSVEVGWGSNPTLPDSDLDGLLDGLETNPRLDDDGDGLTNLLDSDRDNDGLPDGLEFRSCGSPTCMSPTTDNDGDGLSNLDEVGLGTDPARADTDGDGLTDRAEVLGGTDPVDPDMDGDGFPDGFETAAGSDPRNPASVPVVLSATEAVGKPFSVLSTASPAPPASREAAGRLISLLNRANPGPPPSAEATGKVFSLLNTALPPTPSLAEAIGKIFSLLNAAGPAPPASAEAASPLVSVENTTPP